jgi:4-hydroxy-tetrahydrodipicolinate reductase
MESDDLMVDQVVDRSGGPGYGQDAGRVAGMPDSGIRITDELRPRRGSVVVDFSLPSATATNIERCREAGVPLVLGTTGLDETTERLLQEATSDIPCVWAANFSVGITLLQRLAALASRTLGPRWETEIIELHHKHKRDSPSGTALRLGQAVAAANGRVFSDVAVTDRSARDRTRTPEEIGVFGLRGGDSPGEHTVLFFGHAERIELTHRATDRAIFARGALRAAHWVKTAEPGLYDMVDVLGLEAFD